MTGFGSDRSARRRTQESWRARFSTSSSALRTAQKTARGVSLYSTWINRPFGRRLAALADVWAFKPNHVTVLSASCSFAAITALIALRPSLLSGVLASSLLVLGFALDSADGQLARLRRAGSAAGEYLDHMLDCAVKSTLHAAVLIAAYRLGQRGAELLVPLGFLIVALLLFFGGILVAKLREQSTQGEAVRPARRISSRVSSVLLLPADHGVVALSFLLWGSFEVFSAVYLLLFMAHVALLAAFSVAWFRELSG
ncbi:MAG: CDP-alcohol phosphatidyltransferase family protein [Actinomycetota bacterium]|nr:CDP-alcohol phosphatidyltransferase family protein [Actinomycetota bacterium]